jgi:hypothetical protein
MAMRSNTYLAGGLLSVALMAASCAAKDTDVRTGPIRGESSVQQDNSGSSSSRSRDSSGTSSNRSRSDTERGTSGSSSSSSRSGSGSGY